MNDPAVEAVAAEVYTVPTDAPEADGTLTWEATTLVLARVEAGGVQGLGWTYGSPACAALITGMLADVVRGRPAMDVPGNHETMLRAVRNITRQGTAGYAISALDVALWDLKAKLLGLPLYRLLGAVRDRVPVYGSGGFTTYDESQLREQLSGWASAAAAMTRTACARSGTRSLPTWRPVSTAGTCTTSAGCALRAPWTACRPTCHGAAASPSGCGSRL